MKRNYYDLYKKEEEKEERVMTLTEIIDELSNDEIDCLLRSKGTIIKKNGIEYICHEVDVRGLF